MPTWIRFHTDDGNTTLVNADRVHLVFKPSEYQVEVYSVDSTAAQAPLTSPLLIFPCETERQVTAAEELIFDALEHNRSITIRQDALEEYAEYLDQVNGIRMVLQLIHAGQMRFPVEGDDPEGELFAGDEADARSEVARFEETLATFLDVPPDSLRRAYQKHPEDAPFSLVMDHEECSDHGFHEYWVVRTRPDRHYTFREKYQDLARTLVEKDGFQISPSTAL
ncbi:MAG: hypothetical protein OEV94_07380 [Deltaproteobacteria bacterium]|nr:hypothetical protein [Deltaproteobacteria bacterium]